MNQNFAQFVFVICSCVLLVGCGGRAQVSGKVTFEGDGTPLTRGNVKALSDDGVAVKGTIKEDGTYLLYELKPGDGIPSGKKYKVWLANTTEKVPSTQKVLDDRIGEMVPAPPTIVQLVDSTYITPNSTPLELDVPKGTASISHDIVVKKPE